MPSNGDDIMKKKRLTKYDSKIIEELKKLPSPIHDKRHNWDIYFTNDRARSNQNRFEHISRFFHELTAKDIKSIPEAIASGAILKMEKGRKDTFNYYFLRKGPAKRYVKISVQIFDWKRRSVKVKTIVTTNKLK